MIRLGEVGSNRSELCVGFSQEFSYYSNHNGKPRDGFMQRSDLAAYLKNKTVLFKTHRERRTRYVFKRPLCLLRESQCKPHKLSFSTSAPRQHIKKQRHYFADKGPSSQSCGFPVVMYGCESGTIKQAERRRTDAFELWCWRRLLRVPWTARSSQSILKEISPEYSLEGLMLKLKLQYFGHLM